MQAERREPYPASPLTIGSVKGAEMIKPIHELPADELQSFLNAAREQVEFLYTHDETNPEETREVIKRQAISNLSLIVDSIKNSLLFLFPENEKLFLSIVDANEAAYAMTWKAGKAYPIDKGILALEKTYGVIHGCWEPDYFPEMETAVKEYALIATYYYHERWETTALPLIEEGIKRDEQIHAPKDKKNPYIKKACEQLARDKRANSAKELFNRFPVREKALTVDGAQVFREEAGETGDEKIVVLYPSGKVYGIMLQAFAKNYYTTVKKNVR